MDFFTSKQAIDQLKNVWTDRHVRVRAEAATGSHLTRFAGRVGKVITVTYSGRALVDFCDGAWYDIANFATVLEFVTDENEVKKYDNTVNSAQKLPTRQS